MAAPKLENPEKTQRSHLDQRNGIIIPIKMRKKLGLVTGDPVSITLEEDAIVIRKVELNELIEKRKSLLSFVDSLKPATNWSVEDFLQEKKKRDY